MKRTTFLLLAFSFCLSQTEAQRIDQAYNYPYDCNLVKDLATTMEKLSTLTAQMTLMETRLQKAEKEVEDMKKVTWGQPQVAFSATLRESGSGDTGPFSIDTPLQYKNVFSNMGSCYNPATGLFTARVRGMYYFRFTMMNNLSTKPMSVASLMKNSQRLASVWDTAETDANDSGSNGVVIALEVGDSVYVQLAANRLVFDNSMNFNTFSGFLLFSMGNKTTNGCNE